MKIKYIEIYTGYVVSYVNIFSQKDYLPIDSLTCNS